jgi:hypothetical protein
LTPKAAEVVRRVFALTIEGKGPVQIARILADDKIERPSYYHNSRGIINCAAPNKLLFDPLGPESPACHFFISLRHAYGGGFCDKSTTKSHTKFL